MVGFCQPDTSRLKFIKERVTQQLPWQIEEGDNPGELQKADLGEPEWALADGVFKRSSD